jgi:hypothetical protein
MNQPLCGANRLVLFQDSRRKLCWLPSDESSPWHYCRHCSFTQKEFLIKDAITTMIHRKDDMLMPTGTKEKLLTVLQYPWFKEHCRHPASRIHLYHLMILMKKHKSPVYSTYLDDPRLSSSFLRMIQSHRPQDNNDMACKVICDLVGKDRLRIPRECPLCLSTLWKRERMNRELYAAVTQYFRDYTRKSYHLPNPQEIMKDYIRHSISLGDSNRQYALSALFVHLNRQNEDKASQQMYEFLQDFLLEDSETFGAIVGKKSELLLKICPQWLLPLEFETGVIEPAYRQWKQWMKARCDTYKEELMIKTCHPRRLFTWIFDIEELKDFEPYDEEKELLGL